MSAVSRGAGRHGQPPRRPARTFLGEQLQEKLTGAALLVGIVALMWIVEAINSIDSGALDGDGIYARDLGRLWGILTSPFIHASFGHLFDNTVPFLFLGLIIALRGAARLAFITAFVIVIGGLGTWLISPATSTVAGVTRPVDTIGASGVVFGYAGYLLARGFFDRRILELLVGAVVAVIWGVALISSLVPHQGVSWEAHLCGGIAGVLAAWVLSARDGGRRRARAPRAGKPASAATSL